MLFEAARIGTDGDAHGCGGWFREGGLSDRGRRLCGKRVEAVVFSQSLDKTQVKLL